MNQKLRNFRNPDEYLDMLEKFQIAASMIAQFRWQDDTLSGWIFSFSNLPCRYTLESQLAPQNANHYCPDTKSGKPITRAFPGNWTRTSGADGVILHFCVAGCHRMDQDTWTLCIRPDGIYRHKVGQCDAKLPWSPED